MVGGITMNNNKSKPYNKKSNRKPRGKQQNRNDTRCQDTEAKKDKMSSLNDVSWYNKFPELLESAGRIPFAKYPGMDIPFGKLYTKDTANSIEEVQAPAYGYPGFLEIDWVPSVGYSANNTSPISTAAKELYAKVRAKFSGALDEDAPDIIMYLMALDSIFAYIGYLKRIYRALNTYSPTNTMFPDGVLKCMEITSAEAVALRKDKTKFWGQINDLILQASKFTCPDVMDIFSRHYWMSSNVYGDAPSSKAQFYVFNQTHFYEFDETGSTGGALTLISGPSEHTPDAYYEYGRSLISKLAASDDAYTINGHLLRAFEGSANFVVAKLEEDELLDAVYVPEVLSQIHNIRSMNGSIKGSDFAITQDPTTNAIIHVPKLTVNVGSTASMFQNGTFAGPNTTLLLDLMTYTPTAGDIAVATRLTTMAGDYDAQNHQFTLIGGTEIVWSMSIVYYDSTYGTPRAYAFSSIVSTLADGSTAEQILQTLGRLSAFDWHPLIYVAICSDGAITALYPCGDLYNPTVVGLDTMRDLHRVCVLSEFNAYGIS
nr:MAG: putative capsid protein [Picobirnavirus sp.]